MRPVSLLQIDSQLQNYIYSPSNALYLFKMPVYAKDQPDGFTNAIERVAIVGVSTVGTRHSTTLTDSRRLEAPLGHISQLHFSKQEDTQ